MPKTKRGDELADQLLPFIGQTDAIRETCAAITAEAASYNRKQEKFCSDEMSADEHTRLSDAESEQEQRIASLVQDLPQCDDGPWSVKFTGDPRGWTVRLITPAGREIGCDG